MPPLPADTLCLLANFVLKVWAVREAVVELAVCQSAAELAATPFYALTYVLVVAAYGISVLVPSIYVSGPLLWRWERVAGFLSRVMHSAAGHPAHPCLPTARSFPLSSASAGAVGADRGHRHCGV